MASVGDQQQRVDTAATGSGWRCEGQIARGAVAGELELHGGRRLGSTPGPQGKLKPPHRALPALRCEGRLGHQVLQRKAGRLCCRRSSTQDGSQSKTRAECCSTRGAHRAWCCTAPQPHQWQRHHPPFRCKAISRRNGQLLVATFCGCSAVRSVACSGSRHAPPHLFGLSVFLLSGRVIQRKPNGAALTCSAPPLLLAPSNRLSLGCGEPFSLRRPPVQGGLLTDADFAATYDAGRLELACRTGPPSVSPHVVVSRLP